jgi:hypothetical protein
MSEPPSAAQPKTGALKPAADSPPADLAPIKLPNPPDEKQPEIPKVGSRDAPGG